MLTVSKDSPMKIENCVRKVLESIVTRLHGQHFYPPMEYGPATKALNHVIPAPLDVIDELPEEELQKAADALLLQIREGGYDKFSDLPLPRAVELGCTCRDKESGVAVRFVRFFDPQEMKMQAGFSVGVHA